MEFLLILFLILLNGFFAMAEIAIVSARKSKLQQLIAKGNKKAQIALNLAQNPDEFFPTVQIGITLISILAGAFGGATLTIPFSQILKQIPFIGIYHNTLSFIIVVGGITYISLIIGELVPKQIAISHAEKIAVFVAPYMRALLRATLPLVKFLSASSEFVLKILRINPNLSSNISEDEVRLLMREGTRIGIFNLIEKKLVDRVLHLDILQIDTLMTPREAIEWFDINKFPQDLKSFLAKYKHSRIVLCDKTLDNLVGMIHLRDLLREYINNPKMNIKDFCQKPHLIPEDALAIKTLELLRQSPIHLALVVDETGKIRGLVTFNDVLEAIIGDIQARKWIKEVKAIKRPDKSLLLDGMLTLEELIRVLKLKKLPKEAYKHATLGGFVLAHFHKPPTEGDKFEWEDYQFEIIDMDGNRIDKVLVAPL